jgi:hypothetical protein
MEIETPLVLTGLSKLLRPIIIYGGIVPYVWISVASAAGVETAWVMTATIAGALTIRALVRQVNCRDGARRFPESHAVDKAQLDR